MRISEILPALNVTCRVLVRMRSKNGWFIPLGGGSAELVLKYFGNLEVVSTSVTDSRNICFLVAYNSEYENL